MLDSTILGVLVLRQKELTQRKASYERERYVTIDRCSEKSEVFYFRSPVSLPGHDWCEGGRSQQSRVKFETVCGAQFSLPFNTEAILLPGPGLAMEMGSRSRIGNPRAKLLISLTFPS